MGGGDMPLWAGLLSIWIIGTWVYPTTSEAMPKSSQAALPSYNIYRFAQEHLLELSIAIAALTIIIATLLRKFVSSSNKDADTNKGSAEVAKLHRRIPHSSEDAAGKEQTEALDEQGDGEASEDDSDSDYKIDADEIKPFRMADGRRSLTTTGGKIMAKERTKDGDDVASLESLHGKWASAEMNLKEWNLEGSLTMDERKEEAEIRRKQLESIFSLLSSNKEKYGIKDRAELLEQMRMYRY